MILGYVFFVIWEYSLVRQIDELVEIGGIYGQFSDEYLYIREY